MGGNGAYSRLSGGIPDKNRSHYDTRYRIDGHKVLVQKENAEQNKTPMNANSENPIYLCGKVDSEKKIHISTIAIYEKHKLVGTVDLVFDKGKVVPYGKGRKFSHFHKWLHRDGEVGRKAHQPSNNLPIPEKYAKLIRSIETFNQQGKSWKRRTATENGK